jgi:RNA polymerase sigma-70 factor (ECF subfamily)
MAEAQDPADITQLLKDIRGGSQEAEERLMPIVYQELHRIAHSYMRKERLDHTLQTTALVHEAYLKLIGVREVDWVDRSHFFAVAAQLMRRILVDYARARRASKRGGSLPMLPLDGAMPISDESLEFILSIHEALDRLAVFDARQARVVELRFFSGLSVDETARVIGVSSRTVKRDWDFAQAWLYKELSLP